MDFSHFHMLDASRTSMGDNPFSLNDMNDFFDLGAASLKNDASTSNLSISAGPRLESTAIYDPFSAQPPAYSVPSSSFSQPALNHYNSTAIQPNESYSGPSQSISTAYTQPYQPSTSSLGPHAEISARTFSSSSASSAPLLLTPAHSPLKILCEVADPAAYNPDLLMGWPATLDTDWNTVVQDYTLFGDMDLSNSKIFGAPVKHTLGLHTVSTDVAERAQPTFGIAPPQSLPGVPIAISRALSAGPARQAAQVPTAIQPSLVAPDLSSGPEAFSFTSDVIPANPFTPPSNVDLSLYSQSSANPQLHLPSPSSHGPPLPAVPVVEEEQEQQPFDIYQRLERPTRTRQRQVNYAESSESDGTGSEYLPEFIAGSSTVSLPAALAAGPVRTEATMRRPRAKRTNPNSLTRCAMPRKELDSHFTEILDVDASGREEKLYQCNVCGATSKRPGDARRHLAGSHGYFDAAKKDDGFKCQYCPKVFMRKDACRRHMNDGWCGHDAQKALKVADRTERDRAKKGAHPYARPAAPRKKSKKSRKSED